MTIKADMLDARNPLRSLATACRAGAKPQRRQGRSDLAT
jgi:hypothetical protein